MAKVDRGKGREGKTNWMIEEQNSGVCADGTSKVMSYSKSEQPLLTAVTHVICVYSMRFVATPSTTKRDDRFHH